MKKNKNIFGILMLIAVLGISSPVVAQTSDSARNTTAYANDNRDDNTGKWGLLGLAGLLGLLGLRKKEDNYNNRTTTNTNR